MAQQPPYPGAPRWVQLSGIAAGLLMLAILMMLLLGGGHHGPSRHMQLDPQENASKGASPQADQ